MSQEFKSKAVACWYSWQECYILYGLVDDSKSLVIEKEILFQKTSIEVVAGILKGESNIWINYHPPLARLIENCHQVDFNNDNLRDIESLEDLFLCLKAENRLFLGKEIKQASFANNSNCLKLLLKALTDDLCGDSQRFSGDLGTVKRDQSKRFRRFL